jgi:hypothetical protein
MGAMPENPMRQADETRSSGRELSFRSFAAQAGAAFLVTWGIVWIYIAAFPMAYQSRDYPLMRAKEQLLAQCRPNAVVVFGDSKVVAGVLPSVMNIPVENLAFPAATPVETYFFAKRLLRCPETPRLVVIAHSASQYPQDKFFWSILTSAGVLDTADIHAVEADANTLGDDELERAERPNAVPLALLPELYAIRFPPLYFGNLLGGYVAARWRYNERAYQETILSGGRSSFGTADRSDGVGDEAAMTDWQVSPLINLYMNRTLDLLAAHHVPVVIITLPMNDATCAHLPPVIQPRFSAYLAGIAEAHPNVELADPTIPCWPDHYFGDDMHFNMSGALSYSHRLQYILTALLRENDNEATAQPLDRETMLAWINASVRVPAEPETPDD